MTLKVPENGCLLRDGKEQSAMAIYHLEAKVISRGIGRSAVAASAYMSCSKIFNDYDGVQHDYTRKHGLIYEQVLLPPPRQMISGWRMFTRLIRPMDSPSR